uniref:Urease accessory protein UreH-like transmembrane domain-containing protein n=1 Tax=Guillardia theta TaxID=55529 RepID=A0A7S4NPN4_GUITH
METKLASNTRSSFSPLTIKSKRTTSLTSVNMGLEFAALAGRSVVLGGALAGGLHAVSGPDHFPALLPRCLGKPWLPAAKIGSLWGLGHALSAMAIGLAVFLIKDKALTSHPLIAGIAIGADIAIGLSLCFIGFLSWQEARGRDFAKDLGEAKLHQKQSVFMKANTLLNGLFHGLSLDGVPTLMPVLGLGSLSTALTFLASYGLGVMIAMTCATVFIGQGTMSLAESTNFDLGKLVRGTAIAAIVIGVLWTLRAIFFPA